MIPYKYTLISIIASISVCGCTLSFNNISTEGQASDVLEEKQSADGKVDPVLNIPTNPL